MAFRRRVAARAKLFYQQQQQRAALPLSRIDRDDNDRRRQDFPIYDLRRGDNVGSFSFSGSRNLFGDRRFAVPAAYAPVFVRNMSNTGRGTENVAITTDNFEMMTEGAERAIEAVAPVANEVAAAACGYFPVDMFMYLIDYVHTFTGCNWWVSIALSTILMRTLLLPFTIRQTKATYIYTLIWRQVEEIENEIKKSREDKIAMSVAEARMTKLLNEHGLDKFSTTATFAVIAYVNHLLSHATFKMVGKIESFKHGGALWFTDLTTPDPTYILPLLAAFTFWRAMECHADAKFDHVSRGVFAGLTIPLAACTPKAILCMWITSNVYGLAYGMVMKKAQVKKMLGIPNVAEAPRDLDGSLVVPASFGEWLMPGIAFSHLAVQILHQK